MGAQMAGNRTAVYLRTHVAGFEIEERHGSHDPAALDGRLHSGRGFLPAPKSAWRVRTSFKPRRLYARTPDLRTQVLAFVHL